MRAKAKKTPMCSVSLIAIELKGLAAPGEALKNNTCPYTKYDFCVCVLNFLKNFRAAMPKVAASTASIKTED